MVDPEAQLDRLFRALGSGPRRAILKKTARRRCAVSELAASFDMSLEAVSKHVRVLEDAGLVKVVQEGRTRFCRLEPKGLDRAQRTVLELTRFWEQRLDALEGLLQERRGRR